MLQKAAQRLGYTFKCEKLLREAFCHASSADHRLQSNERMEFLGDAILGYVVCEQLFKLYPDLLEGEMTKIKSAVVSRKVCAQISQKIDLVSMLNLGKGMSSRPDLPPSVMAAVLEAVIAAIYLDGGIEPAQKFILEHMGPFITEAAESAHQENYKSVLQHYAQKSLPGNPSYVVLDEKGPDHSKAFEVAVMIDSRRFTSAWANTKKEAEQKAALLALTELGVLEKEKESTEPPGSSTGTGPGNAAGNPPTT
ncbi:MAG: ribonuclease III [Planctomycetota bacterium]|nr:ribonuclease III [Planctomycetota bacterium]